eukprot:g476.t1
MGGAASKKPNLQRGSSFRIMDAGDVRRERKVSLFRRTTVDLAHRLSVKRRSTARHLINWKRPSTWTPDAVRLKLAMDTYWVSTVDEDGRLPLHNVASRCNDVGVVRLLLDKFPAAIRKRDGAGLAPLHRAAWSGNSAQVVVLLLRCCPEMLGQVSHNGSLPLHFAAEGAHPRNSPAVVQVLLAAGAEALCERDEHGWLPLHRAAAYSAAEGVVEAIASAYPAAIGVANDVGNLPWHVAAMQSHLPSSLRVLGRYLRKGKLEQLLDRVREAERVRAQEQEQQAQELQRRLSRRTRLRGTMAPGADRSAIVRSMQQAQSLALKEMAKTSPVPSRRGSAAVAAEAETRAGVCNNSGSTALHLAAWRNSSPDVLSELLRMTPSDARARDHFGMLPLHYAACSNSLQIVRLLAAGYPQGPLCRSAHEKLPHDMAPAGSLVWQELRDAHAAGGWQAAPGSAPGSGPESGPGSGPPGPESARGRERELGGGLEHGEIDVDQELREMERAASLKLPKRKTKGRVSFSIAGVGEVAEHEPREARTTKGRVSFSVAGGGGAAGGFDGRAGGERRPAMAMTSVRATAAILEGSGGSCAGDGEEESIDSMLERLEREAAGVGVGVGGGSSGARGSPHAPSHDVELSDEEDEEDEFL